MINRPISPARHVASITDGVTSCGVTRKRCFGPMIVILLTISISMIVAILSTNWEVSDDQSLSRQLRPGSDVRRFDPQVAVHMPRITVVQYAGMSGRSDYSLSVFDDGRVEYEGRSHVRIVGNRNKKIQPDQLTALLAVMDGLRLFDPSWDFADVAPLDGAISTVTYRQGLVCRSIRFNLTSDADYAAFSAIHAAMLSSVGLVDWVGIRVAASVSSGGLGLTKVGYVVSTFPSVLVELHPSTRESISLGSSLVVGSGEYDYFREAELIVSSFQGDLASVRIVDGSLYSAPSIGDAVFHNQP